MKIDRKKLLEKLAMAIPGINQNGTGFQGTDTFFFEKKTVSSFSSRVAIHVGLDEDTGVTGALHAKKLHDVLKKITSESVDLTEVEGNVHIEYKNSSGGKGSIKMVLQKLPAAFEYVAKVFADPVEWRELPVDFLRVIEKTHIPWNTPEYVSLYTKGDMCFSKSKTQVAKGKFVNFSGDFPPVCIQEKEVKVLLNIPDMVSFTVLDGWIRVKTKLEVVYSLRAELSDGQLENVERTIEKNKIQPEEKAIVVFPNELNMVIDRAVIFSEQFIGTGKNKIDFHINGSVLLVQANTKKYNFCEELKIKSESTKISFFTSGHCIKYALSTSNNLFAINRAGTVILQVEDDDFLWISKAMLLV